jgi:putative selenate reductase
VCPNLALLTYEVEPVGAELERMAVRDGRIVTTGMESFRVDQRLQVAVLTDFCNECGNCTTACPTAGRPYRDKPRLYLDRAEFEAQPSNAFLLLGPGTMEGRYDGATHRIHVDGVIEYSAPGIAARLDPVSLRVLTATSPGAQEGATLSLVPAAQMATLLSGLATSMPHVPVATDGPATTLVPGFRE